VPSAHSGIVSSSVTGDRPHHVPYILYMGGESPTKNPFGALEAYARFIHETRSKSHLVMGGISRGARSAFEREVKKLGVEGKVLFLPYLPREHLLRYFRFAE